MWFRQPFAGLIRSRTPSPKVTRAYLEVEALESRTVLYSASGNVWPHPDLVTISFVPDGTNLNGYSSNLFSTFNAKFGSAATWQNMILQAAQEWAQQTNLNFVVVPDDGSTIGAGSYQQGDSRFGDIRIGGYNFGNNTLAQAYLPPPVNNYSVAGDIQFNTAQNFNSGTTYDLFTVAVHELGHALGLYHGSSGAVMRGTYGSAVVDLATDDINGIRYVVSDETARSADSYDASTNNNSFSSADNISTKIGSTSKAGVINNLDLTKAADVDWYKVTVPSGHSGSLRVTVQTAGISLLAPKVDLFNANQVVKASANGEGQHGTTVTATLGGISSGQTYYIKVSSTDDIEAFKTGRYSLIVNMGSGDDPDITATNTRTANGSPKTSGGGQAIAFGPQVLVNTTTENGQQTTGVGQRAIAKDLLGNSVVVWSSNLRDGSGWGVYAQRYDATGAAVGEEFRVNTTTLGDQTSPTVAIDALGNFVIAWTGTDLLGNADVYARHYTLLGIPLAGEFRVNTTTLGEQSDPSVAMDDLGNFMVTWTSQDSSGTGIYARRYTLLGIPLSGEFRVNATTVGNQSDSSVVMNRITGDYVVTWTSYGQDGSGTGIYGRRSTLLGLLLGSEFRVNATTVGNQTDSSLAINQLTGEYVVTWTSDGADGTDVYARRYNAAGTVQGNEFVVNSTTTGDQSHASASLDSIGNLFVVWTSEGQDGAGSGVFGQLFTIFNERHEGEFQVNNTTDGEQGFATVAQDLLGRAVVVWSGNGVGDSSGVFFQQFGLGAETLSAEGHDHDHDDDHDSPGNDNHHGDVADDQPHSGSSGDNGIFFGHTVQVRKTDHVDVVFSKRQRLSDGRKQDATEERQRSNGTQRHAWEKLFVAATQPEADLDDPLRLIDLVFAGNAKR